MRCGPLHAPLDRASPTCLPCDGGGAIQHAVEKLRSAAGVRIVCSEDSGRVTPCGRLCVPRRNRTGREDSHGRRPAKTGVTALFQGIQRTEWPNGEYSRRKRRGRGSSGAATTARSADSCPLWQRGFRKPPQKGQRGRERPEARCLGHFGGVPNPKWKEVRYGNGKGEIRLVADAGGPGDGPWGLSERQLRQPERVH